MRTAFATLLAASAALGLAGCAQEEENMDYTTDVEDMSGGELIVEDADAPGVDVDVPDTPMVPVSPEEAAARAEANGAEDAGAEAPAE